MDCIQEAIEKKVQTIPAADFSENILFSVQVQLKTNELSTRRIPLSFPVKIGSEKVIFQLLAATFEKVKKKYQLLSSVLLIDTVLIIAEDI